MKRRTLLPTLATLAIGTLLPLAACSESPRTDQASSASQSSDAGNGATGESANPNQAFTEEQLVPAAGYRYATVQTFLSGDTAVVSPTDEADPLYGKTFQVRLRGFDAPKEGECGFEGARDLMAKTYQGREVTLSSPAYYAKEKMPSDYPAIGSDGLPVVGVESMNKSVNPVWEGFTVADTALGGQDYVEDQKDAQEAKRGLWATCPDFGK